uniref:Uncharacterized protein n=1 Tax=Tanacetum cinerariifolium TaxID=118510 RepID=A0A699GKS7_TANCI|nr:hypothetical protein [Tanacetum cinerariifolium]
MKYCENKDDNFTNLKTEYPAKVFNDTSDAALSCEPTISPLVNNEIYFKISFDESDDENYMVFFDEISFSCKITYIDNLKIDYEDDNDKVNMPSSLSTEPTFGYIDDLDFLKDFENEFPAIAYNDLKSKSDPLIETSVNMAPLPHRDLRHPWLRYQVKGYDEGIVHSYKKRLEKIWGRSVNWVHVLDFAGLTDGMRQTLRDKLSMVYTWDDGHAVLTSHTWRRSFEIRGSLVRKLMLEFFSPYRLSDIEIGLDVADSLCFHLDEAKRRMTMIACSVSGKGSTYLGMLGRKNGVRLFGGYFIGRLVAHFKLVSDQGLRGLSVVSSKLPLIDLHELERLNICSRFGDTWAWVASGPERQPDAAASVPRALRMLLQLMRMHELRQSVIGLRGVVERSITKQTRVSIWMISCMTQFMDASGRTFQAFDSTLVGSSWLSYQRHVRPRTSDAITSTTPHTDDQPDP